MRGNGADSDIDELASAEEQDFSHPFISCPIVGDMSKREVRSPLKFGITSKPRNSE
jgi:hypothetical protein